MKRFNDYTISSLLVAFVVALLLTAGSANAITFGERVNVRTTIPVLDPAHESIDCFSYDGLEMYIESDRPGGYGSWDLWVLRRASIDEDWGPPENLGSVFNTAKIDAGASISADGLTLYFSSDRSGGYGSADIYMTTRATKDDLWGPAVNMGLKVNSSASDGCPWISADGLELYFASYLRPGGYGNSDIYVTRRATQNDPWGDAVNIGPVVNSPFEERGSSLSPDGLLLIFAEPSTTYTPRPGGYGGADMWMTMRASLSDPWQTPVNLGPQVNGVGAGVIPRISPDGSTLYYSECLSGIWDNYQAPIFYEPVCGDNDHPYPTGDLNRDCRVNFADIGVICDHWLEDTNPQQQ
jgi:Tol biopolymer transport system component